MQPDFVYLVVQYDLLFHYMSSFTTSLTLRSSGPSHPIQLSLVKIINLSNYATAQELNNFYSFVIREISMGIPS